MFPSLRVHSRSGHSRSARARGLVALALVACGVVVVPLASPAGAVATGRAYVANRDADTVSVVNLASNVVVGTIPVGDRPTDVAVATTGERAYVANQASGTVSVIDTLAQNVVTTIAVGDGPSGLAVTPNGARVYVANQIAGSVSVLDTGTGTVMATVPVGSSPTGVALTPDSTRVYVTNLLSRNVSVIDTLTNTVVSTIAVGSLPIDVAVTPDNTRAYVVNSGLDGSGLSVISTHSNMVVRNIPLAGRPLHVALTPNGARAYVTSVFLDVAVVDTASNAVVATIPRGASGLRGNTDDVAISPDGTHGYVTTGAEVAVFDTSTNSVFTYVPAGPGAGAVATGTVPPRRPHINLLKTATPASGNAPLTVTYSFKLANDGTDTLAQTSVTDDRCAPVTLQGGDADGDQLLDPGETWTFDCVQTHSSTGTYTNRATARGTSIETGLPVSSSSAQATINLTGPPDPNQQPTLSETTLEGPFTTTGFRCFPVQFGYQTTGAVGPSTSTYQPGTFTQSGSVSESGFVASFVIQTATRTRIEGMARGPVAGGCGRGGGTNVFTPAPLGTLSATYEATITTADGKRFSDAGGAFASFSGHAPQEQNLSGGSRLGFVSRFVGAQPIPVAPALTAASPPASGTVGTAYGPYTFTSTGTPAPTFSLASGTLPAGLTLSATGALAGTPTAAGIFTFTIRAANGIGSDAVSAPLTIRVEPVAVSDSSGYWMLGSTGSVYGFGEAAHLGAPTGIAAASIAATPSGNGYWIVSQTGAVHAFGDAASLGGSPPLRPGEMVSSLSPTPTGAGYWLFTSQGRAFPYGTAAFFGDVGGVALDGPIRGSVSTPSGNGYYMVASDGGISAFGDAAFAGSMGGQRLDGPVVGLAPDPDGSGYWLVATDGGIFAFSADFRGSMGGTPLNRPVVGMVSYGDGYLMVASDGGIFNFSTRPFRGSLGDNPPPNPIIAVAPLKR